MPSLRTTPLETIQDTQRTMDRHDDDEDEDIPIRPLHSHRPRRPFGDLLTRSPSSPVQYEMTKVDDVQHGLEQEDEEESASDGQLSDYSRRKRQRQRQIEEGTPHQDSNISIDPHIPDTSAGPEERPAISPTKPPSQPLSQPQTESFSASQRSTEDFSLSRYVSAKVSSQMVDVARQVSEDVDVVPSGEMIVTQNQGTASVSEAAQMQAATPTKRKRSESVSDSLRRSQPTSTPTSSMSPTASLLRRLNPMNIFRTSQPALQSPDPQEGSASEPSQSLQPTKATPRSVAQLNEGGSPIHTGKSMRLDDEGEKARSIESALGESTVPEPPTLGILPKVSSLVAGSLVPAQPDLASAHDSVTASEPKASEDKYSVDVESGNARSPPKDEIRAKGEDKQATDVYSQFDDIPPPPSPDLLPARHRVQRDHFTPPPRAFNHVSNSNAKRAFTPTLLGSPSAGSSTISTPTGRIHPTNCSAIAGNASRRPAVQVEAPVLVGRNADTISGTKGNVTEPAVGISDEQEVAIVLSQEDGDAETDDTHDDTHAVMTVSHDAVVRVKSKTADVKLPKLEGFRPDWTIPYGIKGSS